MQALATMLGSSNFLWEDFLRMQHVNLLPVLREMHATDRPVDAATLRQRLREGLQAADTPAARKAALNTFKDREMFRIDLRHLLRPDLPFGVFADELTDLAEVVVAGALEVAQTDLGERYGRPLLDDGELCPVALFALGKFGGRELGYASDIEMLCVYGGSGVTDGPQRLANTEYATLLVQHLRDLIVARQSGIFEIDLRLRPARRPRSAGRQLGSFPGPTTAPTARPRTSSARHSSNCAGWRAMPVWDGGSRRGGMATCTAKRRLISTPRWRCASGRPPNW